MTAELILVNGRLATLDRANPDPQAVAVAGGKFIAAGADQDVRALAGPGTRIIDLKGRRATTDSHLHIIRGGLNYNMKLRWDGVRSLAVEHRGLSLQSTNINTGYGTAHSLAAAYTSSPHHLLCNGQAVSLWSRADGCVGQRCATKRAPPTEVGSAQVSLGSRKC